MKHKHINEEILDKVAYYGINVTSISLQNILSVLRQLNDELEKNQCNVSLHFHHNLII